MPIYNKLVRDRIPETIERSGKAYTTQILSEVEYIVELQKKLSEELAEYLTAADDSNAIEELADMLELIHSLTTIHSSSMEELERVRIKKLTDRGGFKERIFLIEVMDA